jgi:hypothetical protein
MTSATKNCHTCDLTSSPQTPIATEVVMSPTVTSLDQIDYDISVAYIALGVARSSFDRCPSAENARVVDDAESCVNRLLDERFAAQS